MDTNTLIEMLAAGFRRRTTALFCGAGVSSPSGLPMVGGKMGLVHQILNLTALSEGEKDQVANAVLGPPDQIAHALPFERFMETLLDSMDESAQHQFLRIFSLGEPCRYHRFAAQMIEHGWLRYIFTTNFDTLFERAHGALTPKPKVGLSVTHRLEDFRGIDWDGPHAQLVKLHGSVEDLPHLGVMVRRLARPDAVYHLEPPLQQLFCSTGVRRVLVVGYSFSDRFDIRPAMAQLPVDETAEVIFCDFVKTDGKAFQYEDDVSQAERDRRGFRNFRKVHRIMGDAEVLLYRVALLLGIDAESITAGHVKGREGSQANDSYEEHGPKWLGALRHDFALLNERHYKIAEQSLASLFLSMVGDHAAAIRYCEEAVKLADQADDHRMRLVTLQALCGALLQTGDLHEVQRRLEQMESIARSYKGGKYADHYLHQSATLHLAVGEAAYRKAQTRFQEAHNLADSGKNPIQSVPHLNGLATTWIRLGDLEAAQRCYEAALRIVDDSGDIYRKAELYANIATLAQIMRDFKSALEWYKRAARCSSLAGDRPTEGKIEMNVGMIHQRQGMPDKAIESFERARELLGPTHPLILQLDEYIERARRAGSG